jgi:hypothetical protein
MIWHEVNREERSTHFGFTTDAAHLRGLKIGPGREEQPRKGMSVLVSEWCGMSGIDWAGGRGKREMG